MTSYLTNTAADAIAATLPASLLAAYNALSGSDKTAWLAQASAEIDASMRWQGRKFDLINQVLEFPRVAYESSNRIWPNTGAAPIGVGGAWGDQVWDWDPVNNAAIVPQSVLLAVLHQANFLAGGGAASVDAQFSGVREQHVGSIGETYSAAAGKGVATGLCRRAYQLVQKYQLVSGRIL